MSCALFGNVVAGENGKRGMLWTRLEHGRHLALRCAAANQCAVAARTQCQ